MEFSPANPIIQLCLRGMQQEDLGDATAAKAFFMQAWKASTSDFEKFTAAYYVARHQQEQSDKLMWLQLALNHALSANTLSSLSALNNLYRQIAVCYEAMGNTAEAERHSQLGNTQAQQITDPGPFYHGTRADLQIGDYLVPGKFSNYQSDLVMNHIYFTAMLNGAGLAAALASGDNKERVYIVEPTGDFESDPNVTDKKFPGNPTRSYRTLLPLKIVDEAKEWVRQTPEQIQEWKNKLANNKGEIIN